MPSMKLRKQDKVKVVSGKAKGQEGRIVHVLADENRVIIEGVNMAKKHQKPTKQNDKGGITEKEMPVHISNVMLISPKSNQPVKLRKTVENGRRVRVEKKSGQAID